MAWTSTGGEILHVDATIMAGAEKLILTGHLGDVMKESAQAALSFIRSNSKKLGLPDNFFKGKEIHIHLPEGAIPKDGPSAGVTLAMAIYSAVSGYPAHNNVAMTGEITLRGDILAIGGLNEKLLAARRNGIFTILIPQENEIDLTEIKPEIKDGFNYYTNKKVLLKLFRYFLTNFQSPALKNVKKNGCSQKGEINVRRVYNIAGFKRRREV